VVAATGVRFYRPKEPADVAPTPTSTAMSVVNHCDAPDAMAVNEGKSEDNPEAVPVDLFDGYSSDYSCEVVGCELHDFPCGMM